METFMMENLGVSPALFNYLILPALIFVARVFDVTLSTIKILFVMNGKRDIAPILGFFESLIWLLAIGQIITNIDNGLSYIAYATGFATGTWVGMYIEEKLAVGRVMLRLIVNDINGELMGFLHDNDFRYSLLDAMGKMGKVSIVFFVVERENLARLIEGINVHHPNAFYTIESVKQVSKSQEFSAPISRVPIYRRFSVKRR